MRLVLTHKSEFSNRDDINWLWKNFLSNFNILLENRTFVDARILDEFAGTKILDKGRKLVVVVKSIIQHTQIDLKDVIRNVKSGSLSPRIGNANGSVAVAINIMQQIIFRGATFLPWTQKRRD